MAHSSEMQAGSMAATVSNDSPQPNAPSSPVRSELAALSLNSYPILPKPRRRRRGSVFPDYDLVHRRYSTNDLRRYSLASFGLMREQTQTTMSMRSSPPIQPGETEAKLPSFSEVCLALNIR